MATYTANGSPTWSLEATGDYEDFDIDSASGVLSFDAGDFPNGPDFESAADADGSNDYELTVVATITKGDNSVTGTLDVTVTVTDVNEAPTFDGSSTTRKIDENSAAGRMWEMPSRPLTRTPASCCTPI